MQLGRTPDAQTARFSGRDADTPAAVEPGTLRRRLNTPPRVSTRLAPLPPVDHAVCQAPCVSPRVTYALVVLLVAYVVALAVVSGFGNTAVAVTGWLILTGVFAVVACIQLLRRRS